MLKYVESVNDFLLLLTTGLRAEISSTANLGKTLHSFLLALQGALTIVRYYISSRQQLFRKCDNRWRLEFWQPEVDKTFSYQIYISNQYMFLPVRPRVYQFQIEIQLMSFRLQSVNGSESYLLFIRFIYIFKPRKVI